MGFGSLFNLATKFLVPSSQGTATGQVTGAEQKLVTSIDQVNAAVTRKTNQQNLNLQQQQLHATVEPESVKPAAVVVSGNQEISNQELLEMAQERAKKDPAFHVALMASTIKDNLSNNGIDIKISPEIVARLEPLFSNALKILKEIFPFIKEEIKTILPTSEVDKLISGIIKNNHHYQPLNSAINTAQNPA